MNIIIKNWKKFKEYDCYLKHALHDLCNEDSLWLANDSTDPMDLLWTIRHFWFPMIKSARRKSCLESTVEHCVLAGATLYPVKREVKGFFKFWNIKWLCMVHGVVPAISRYRMLAVSCHQCTISAPVRYEYVFSSRRVQPFSKHHHHVSLVVTLTVTSSSMVASNERLFLLPALEIYPCC